MATARLAAVGVVVAELSRAIAFYRALGAPFPPDAERSPHGHAEADFGGFRLLLDTEDEMRRFDPGWQRGAGTPATAVAFDCDTPAAVDELFKAGLAAGGHQHKEPWDAFWGQRYAQLRDPDGNAVDLFAQLPR
jgi:uncharacterized glyoxalase superfamily protein PhnB